MIQLALILLALLLGAAALEQFLSHRIRRGLAQDMQRMPHAKRVFHVVTLFRLQNEQRCVDSARRFCHRILSGGDARLIYAGQTAFVYHAGQLAGHDWDGLIIMQYPSRVRYEERCERRHLRAAAEIFADSYTHGMARNRRVALLLPLALLWRGVRDILAGRWRPATPAAPVVFHTDPAMEAWRRRVDRLKAVNVIDSRALVVYSTIDYGTSERPGILDSYGQELMSQMASRFFGPLHVGKFVPLQGGTRFHRVDIVYYPGATYFANVISSPLFHSLVGSKGLGDITMVATLPITRQL